MNEYDDEVSKPDHSPWIICPTCDGEGHHSRHLGSFTMSEFNECFDDEESREGYFSGRYDQSCNTCQGTGKIRESQWDRHYEEERRFRMLETGRNEAGEPI